MDILENVDKGRVDNNQNILRNLVREKDLYRPFIFFIGFLIESSFALLNFFGNDFNVFLDFLCVHRR
ncbi:hypothetical protein BH23THE1_BH23THE1_08360 [soil metagenome]